MSRKAAIVLSVVLFAGLCALMVCERMNPEAGYALLHSIL